MLDKTICHKYKDGFSMHMFAQMLLLPIVLSTEHMEKLDIEHIEKFNNSEFEEVPESHVTENNSEPSSIHTLSTASSGTSDANATANINYWNNSPGACVKNEESKNSLPRQRLVPIHHQTSDNSGSVDPFPFSPPPKQVESHGESPMLERINAYIPSSKGRGSLFVLLAHTYHKISLPSLLWFPTVYSPALSFQLRSIVMALFVMGVIPLSYSQPDNVSNTPYAYQTTIAQLCSANGTQMESEDYSFSADSDCSYQWSPVVFIIPLCFVPALIAGIFIKLACRRFDRVNELEADMEPSQPPPHPPVQEQANPDNNDFITSFSPVQPVQLADTFLSIPRIPSLNSGIVWIVDKPPLWSVRNGPNEDTGCFDRPIFHDFSSQYGEDASS